MSEPQTSKFSLIPESPPDPSFPEIEPAAAADATRVGDQIDNVYFEDENFPIVLWFFFQNKEGSVRGV